MYISKKKHNKVVNEYHERCEQLKKDLDKAEQLKEVLLKLTDLTVNFDNMAISSGDIRTSIGIEKDMVTGRTIFESNAAKCIKISQDGEVSTGFTEEPLDKGYSYKLIRE